MTLTELVASAVPPSDIHPNALNLCVVQTKHEPGERLDNGDWSGVGGVIEWGVAWFDGRVARKPAIVGGLTSRQALRAIAAMRGTGGHLHGVKEALDRRAAELAAAAEDEETS